MTKLSTIQKFILTIIFSALGAGISVGIFWWLSVGVRDGTEALERIADKITALEKERKVARSFETLLEEHPEYFKRIADFSPNRERPVEFIEELERLAQDTKNSISLDFDEGRSKTTRELVFRVTVEGDEASPRKFLRLLELLPYEIQIEDLVFQRITPGGTQQEVLSAEQQAAIVGRPTHRLFALIAVRTF